MINIPPFFDPRLYFPIMFGVLGDAFPEAFPAKHRGTGIGLTVTAHHVFGVLAGPSLKRTRLS
jgi:hypothetical protein